VYFVATLCERCASTRYARPSSVTRCRLRPAGGERAPTGGHYRGTAPSRLLGDVPRGAEIGGSAYAAVSLPQNSVGTKQLKKRAVTNSKLANGAVTGAKVRSGSLTGKQINSSMLRQVPSAAHADTADAATNATHAGSADAATNAATPGAVAVVSHTAGKSYADIEHNGSGYGMNATDPNGVAVIISDGVTGAVNLFGSDCLLAGFAVIP
jgi:hypothetical protein